MAAIWPRLQCVTNLNVLISVPLPELSIKQSINNKLIPPHISQAAASTPMNTSTTSVTMATGQESQEQGAAAGGSGMAWDPAAATSALPQPQNLSLNNLQCTVFGTEV